MHSILTICSLRKCYLNLEKYGSGFPFFMFFYFFVWFFSNMWISSDFCFLLWIGSHLYVQRAIPLLKKAWIKYCMWALKLANDYFIYIKNAMFTRLYNRRTDPLRTDINYKILLIINYFYTKIVSWWTTSVLCFCY